MVYTVIDGGAPPEEPTGGPDQEVGQNAPVEVAPGAEAPVLELSIEEKIPRIEAALTDLYQRNNLLLGLLKALGAHKGMKLKSRQMPSGGMQFYWQAEGGRIIMPGAN